MFIKFGFSGTRDGLSSLQLSALAGILIQHTGEFHHGDCVGADTQAHEIARHLGYRIVIHPPINDTRRAHNVGDEILPEAPYQTRNHIIVRETQILLACPKSRQEVGGTWYTINYFRKWMSQHATCGKQGFIILPNGDLGTIVTTPQNKLGAGARINGTRL